MNNSYGRSNFSNGFNGGGYSFGGSSIQGGQNDRLIGSGFVFPFLLGGVTGAAIAPAFWRPPYNRPIYGPGPFYGPYYGGPIYGGPFRPF